jgi:hypothetical protein
MDPEFSGPSADRIRQGKIVVDAVEVSDGLTRKGRTLTPPLSISTESRP